MTQTFDAAALPGLPDPELDPQFYAGVPARRLAAWLVDVLIVLAVGLPLATLFGLATLGFGFALFGFLIMGVGVVYRTLTIASGSATWGMRLMGIELRRADGARLDVLTAFLHTVIYSFCLGVVLLQIASVVAMVATRYGQGAPDLILRTAMINRPLR